MAARRWQDGANLILGSWLFVSPWILGYAGTGAAWNAFVIGCSIVVCAVAAASMPKAWGEIINSFLGVWLVVSPFALGFAAIRLVALHTVLVGILATSFAVWATFSDPRLYKRWGTGSSI